MRRDPGRHRERFDALVGNFVRNIQETRGLVPRAACDHAAFVIVGLSRIANPDIALERGLGTNRRIIAIGRSRGVAAEDELSEFLHERFRQDQTRREHISSLLDDF